MLLTMWGIVMRRKKYRLWQSCVVMLVLIQSLKGNPLDLKAIYSEQISTETNKALEQIAQDYEEMTEVITIGYSTTKQTEIKALKLGKGEKSILINGTHHGREALTTVLILNQISYLAEAYVEKQTINGQDVRTVLNTVSIWFVPLEYDQIWKANKEIPFLLSKEMINLNSHEWQVTINEEQIKGETIFGRGGVPVKGICQALNLNYSYRPEEKQINLSDGNNILSFKQGEKIALYNEEPLEIVVPAHIQEGEMYLPLKNILELFSM